MKPPFLIIDGFSYIFSSFFGMPPLTSPEGKQVQAIYAFANLILRLQKEFAPTHWAVALDSKAPTFRHERYAEYKANRDEMPEDLKHQIPTIVDMIEDFRIPLSRLDGYEADDLVATMASRAAEQGHEVYVISRDKDLEQILSKQIQVWDPKTSETFGPKELMKKRGIRPNQVIDYLALVGDSSDNVPGVAGIGPKTALQILEVVKEARHAFADPMPEGLPKRAIKKIEVGKENFELSHELVTLCLDAPIPEEMTNYEHSEPNVPGLQELFEKLGFHRFLKEIGAAANKAAEGTYHFVDTEEKWQKFIAELGKVKEFAVDTETTSLTTRDAELVGLSFCWEEAVAYYIPTADAGHELFRSAESILEELKPVLENPSIGKLGQNLKYDAKVLRNYGIVLKGTSFDSMIAAYLLNPLRRGIGLDAQVLEQFNHHMIPISDLLGPKGKDQKNMGDLRAAEISDYAAEDADFTWRLCKKLEPMIEEAGLSRVFYEVELPLTEVLTSMEFEGITLDQMCLQDLEDQLEGAVSGLKEKIYAEAGQEFNIQSPKQLEKILFDELDFPVIKKTKTSRSTSAEVLNELIEQFPDRPLPSLIVNYRTLAKLLSTYVRALPKMVVKKTGRLHTDFSQTTAATGRLSSSDPNLQNIPIRHELGRQIRKAFIPNHNGNLFLAADYSQIEIRLMAHLSEDPTLISALVNDADIHREVAAKINNKKSEDVTKDERSAAKAINFGVIYGMGAFGLSSELRISMHEAQKFIDTFFGEFPGVKSFIENTIEDAREQKEVRTLLGRCRPLPDIDARIQHRRLQAERFAVNTVVQGTAADLIKIAMIDLHKDQIHNDSPRTMLLQIHDELLFEIPEASLEEQKGIIKESMESTMELRVPLKVEMEIGSNWFEASK